MEKVRATILRLFPTALLLSAVIGAFEVAILYYDAYFARYALPFRLYGLPLQRFLLHIAFPYGVSYIAWHFIGKSAELRRRGVLLSVVVSLLLGSLLGYATAFSVGWHLTFNGHWPLRRTAEYQLFSALSLFFVSFAAVATEYLLTHPGIKSEKDQGTPS